MIAQEVFLSGLAAQGESCQLDQQRLASALSADERVHAGMKLKVEPIKEAARDPATLVIRG